MSQKFISLDDAAVQLGVSKDRLNELREAGDLRAYRDGASWKFRTEEIDKFAESGDLNTGDAALVDDEEDELVLGVEPLGDGDDAESILLTDDDELEGGIPRPQSTIIGKSELSLEDDLALASESGTSPELNLVDETSATDTGADKTDDAATGGSFDDLEELELDLEAESSRILDPATAAAAKEAAEKSKEQSNEPSGLDLEVEDDYELELVGSSPDVTDQPEPSKETGSGSSAPGSIAGLSGLEDIQLGEDEQDDLVLGDSDSSLASSDSGINLMPSDSGIALDDVPLDLGGSAIGSALDLAALSAASAEQSKISEEGSLAAAEDFELTPVSTDEDDEEDSSQIVSLDEIQEDDDVGIAAFEEVEELSEGEEEGAGFASGFGSGMPSSAEVSMASPAGAAATVAAASVEQVAFPGWVIALLSISVITMTLCGMMAFDLLQSMWAWDEPFSVNSALMDVFAGG